MTENETKRANNQRPQSNWAQITSAITSVMALLVSLAVLCVVYFQIQFVGRNADKANARTVYMSYSEAALRYPEFVEPNLAAIKANSTEFIRYKSYFSHMLFAYDEILATEPDSKEWMTSLQMDLQDHVAFLCEPAPAGFYDMYYPRLRKIVADFKQKACSQPSAPSRAP